VNPIIPRIFGSVTGWSGDGPWRSKTVLAALGVVVVGLGFWFSDVKKGPPQSEANTAAASGAELAPANTTGAPAATHWDWKKPFPTYVRVGLSYAVGYCIGWLFRKLIRIILVIGALIIGLLVFGKYAGCDMTRAQEQVKRSGEWAQHEAAAAQDYIKKLLPSAAGGGVGAFLGFRRRSKAAPPKPSG
jgi:uncharacterized membrane protein (Fun14 family)